jgi:predicted site-specific integrase-resolvase
MLAVMKSKRKGTAPNEGNGNQDTKKPALSSPSDMSAIRSSYPSTSAISEDPESSAKVLCALGGDSVQIEIEENDEISIMGNEKARKSSNGNLKQQHQLPMFLSKTYHMIDRCEQDIATWSDNGDSFVVKDVNQFAESVLPQYFKHSNFSSFARQLNFYGFRKVKAEPILTADFDARTACYVRFYHEKFQKNRPDLLAQIKRATKSDQQSKDDVEYLKSDIAKLKMEMKDLNEECDRKIAKLSAECHARINHMAGQNENLVVMIQRLLATQASQSAQQAAQHAQRAAFATQVPVATATPALDMMSSLSQIAALALRPNVASPSIAQATSTNKKKRGTKRKAANDNLSYDRRR